FLLTTLKYLSVVCRSVRKRLSRPLTPALHEVFNASSGHAWLATARVDSESSRPRILVNRLPDKAIQVLGLQRLGRDTLRRRHRSTHRIRLRWTIRVGFAYAEDAPGSIACLDGNKHGIKIIPGDSALASSLVDHDVKVVGRAMIVARTD